MGECKQRVFLLIAKLNTRYMHCFAAFHHGFIVLRQSGIDEELFEVVSGFEAMSRSRSSHRREGNMIQHWLRTERESRKSKSNKA